MMKKVLIILTLALGGCITQQICPVHGPLIDYWPEDHYRDYHTDEGKHYAPWGKLPKSDPNYPTIGGAW